LDTASTMPSSTGISRISLLWGPDLPSNSAPHLLSDPVRVRNHTRAIERAQLAIFHQYLPVHDRRPHVVAASHVNEMRDHVVHRRLPRSAHRHGDQIRLLAGLERSD